MKKVKLFCFRDLGGIECADGRKVKQGVLYRSGHLGKLKMKHAERLQNLYRIAHIVDLRSNSEVLEHPDVVAGMQYCRFTPLDDSRNPSVNRKNRLSILERLMAKEGGTKKHLCDTYRSIIRLPESIEAYRGFMDLLLNADGGVLWHCTQGKDRTGLGSAILLMALGADKQDILEDYLAYNRLCSLRNKMIFIGVAILKFSPHMARSLNNLLTAQKEYLLAAFDEIERLYQTTDAFLKEALLLTDDKLHRLRAMYLI